MCPEKLALAEDYEATTSTFSEAVTVLHQKMGTSVKVEYERLSRLADEARLKSESARLALEKHRAAHGC